MVNLCACICFSPVGPFFVSIWGIEAAFQADASQSQKSIESVFYWVCGMECLSTSTKCVLCFNFL
jgi:hypothetical protein